MALIELTSIEPTKSSLWS